MILFFALLFVAMAIAGACAFVIFWPLALVHIRDRHPALRTSFGERRVPQAHRRWAGCCAAVIATLDDRNLTGSPRRHGCRC